MTPLHAITTCFVATAICFSLIIYDTLSLTSLKMEVPELEQQIKRLDGEIRRLEIELDAFKSPINLIRLMKKPVYSHLRRPYEDE